MSVLSHACNVWCVMLEDELHSEHTANLSPFSLRLMESQLDSETCIFFFFADRDVAVFQNVQKANVYNVRQNVMVISEPYECPT